LPGGAHRAAPEAIRHGFEWRLLGLATGHHTAERLVDDHRHPICPAYAALGALGAFAAVAAPAAPALVAAPALSAPALVAPLPAFAMLASEPECPPAAGYRSRAPPLG
jgi:hypothetical protein